MIVRDFVIERESESPIWPCKRRVVVGFKEVSGRVADVEGETINVQSWFAAYETEG